MKKINYLLLSFIVLLAIPIANSKTASDGDGLFRKLEKQQKESSNYVAIMAKAGMSHVLFKSIENPFISHGQIFLCLMDLPGLEEHNFYFYEFDGSGKMVVLTESPGGMSEMLRNERDVNFSKINPEDFSRSMMAIYRPLYRHYELLTDGQLAGELRNSGIEVAKAVTAISCEGGRKCFAILAFMDERDARVVAFTFTVGLGMTCEEVITCRNVFQGRGPRR